MLRRQAERVQGCSPSDCRARRVLERSSFTVHDGDLEQGPGRPCDDNLHCRSRAFFDQSRAPVMFTPGVSDGTDCDRRACGGFDSLDRLDRERLVFFSTPYAMVRRKMCREIQSEARARASAAWCPAATRIT